jgi:hypothetical protein
MSEFVSNLYERTKIVNTNLKTIARVSHYRLCRWCSKNGYDYSKTMPRNYYIPKPMLDKAIKWYRILFVIGIIIAMSF